MWPAANTVKSETFMILTTVYKVVVGNKQNVSTFICDLSKQIESIYNLRGDATLTLPKVNTTNYGLKSIRYEGGGHTMERRTKLKEYRQITDYRTFGKSILKIDLASRYILTPRIWLETNSADDPQS